MIARLGPISHQTRISSTKEVDTFRNSIDDAKGQFLSGSDDYPSPNVASSGLSKWPAEILETIFCYLSEPSLDAMRLTCKSYFRWITNSPHILRTVLNMGVTKDKQALSVAFDDATTLPSTANHKDS